MCTVTTSGIDPQNLAKTIHLLHEIWQTFVWGNPIAGIADDKFFKPRHTESVFGFLQRVFGSAMPTPKYAQDTKAVHDCCAVLDLLKLNDETTLAQQKIADMLSLAYSTKDGLCDYDIGKYSRPLTNRDATLLREAFHEALIVTLRYVHHNTLKQCISSRSGESYKLFGLYTTVSKQLELLRPLQEYQDVAEHFTYANTAVHDSVFYAYDQCYKTISEYKLHKLAQGEMLHLNDLTFPASTTALALIGYDIKALESQIYEELSSGQCVNVIDSSTRLIDLLEAIRTEYFRHLLAFGPQSNIDSIIETLSKV